MSNNRLYKIRLDGEPVEGFGPYRDENDLIEALREITESIDLGMGSGIVHVYETDNSQLGIGRKYIGHIEAGIILMTGEVNEERIVSS